MGLLRLVPETRPSIADYQADTGIPSLSGIFDASNEPVNTDPTGWLGVIGGVDSPSLLRYLENNPALIASSLQSAPRSDVWHVRLRDGVSRNELVSYLMADAAHNNNRILNRWAQPPIIRVVQGTSSTQENYARSAVQLLNSALPSDWQIRFSDQRAPSSSWTQGRRDRHCL